MAATRGISSNCNHILPQLLTLDVGPAIVTLKDWDYKLRCTIDHLREGSVNGFHSDLETIGAVLVVGVW
jgi:hypothetical protein